MDNDQPFAVNDKHVRGTYAKPICMKKMPKAPYNCPRLLMVSSNDVELDIALFFLRILKLSEVTLPPRLKKIAETRTDQGVPKPK